MKKGNQNPLESGDLWEPMSLDSTKTIYLEFQSFRQSHPKWSMKACLIFSLFPLLPLQLFLAFGCVFLEYVPTLLLFYVVQFLREADAAQRLDAIWYFVYIFTSSMIYVCVFGQVQYLATRCGMRLRALLVSLLFC